jgi:hypothetical protein
MAGGQEYRIGNTRTRNLTCSVAGNLLEGVAVEEIQG